MGQNLWTGVKRRWRRRVQSSRYLKQQGNHDLGKSSRAALGKSCLAKIVTRSLLVS